VITVVETRRAGMTLIELLVALTVFSIVIAGALGAFQKETQVFRRGNERLGVLQNYRFAVNAVEQDLQAAGSGVTTQQPVLIYAGADVVAFNADYASRTAGDISAVYVDTAATDAEVMALKRPRRITLPATSFSYPDTTYLVGGVNGPAETIIFFFAEDSITARDDDYVLYRQANDLAPELVARDLLRTDDGPFFTYYELLTSDTAASRVVEVPSGVLPLAHSVPIHASPADTGAAARIDGIRGVRVELTATNGLAGDEEHTMEASRLVWLPNVGLVTSTSCGGKPLAVSTPGATGVIDATSGEPQVELTWSRSPDEGGGEADVVRYVVWRRLSGAGDWGAPYLSIPAGASSYSYTDRAVDPGVTYEYAVSAQDCTPTLSDQSGAVAVTVPTP